MRDVERFGRYALVNYRGGVEGEEPFEDYFDDAPRKFRLGYNEVPRGIEDALFEMAIGETRDVVVPPEKAYGTHDPAGVQVRMRADVPDGETLEVGSVLGWTSPISRQVLPVRVVVATQDYVKLDYNHPLADKTLMYTLHLVDVVDE